MKTLNPIEVVAVAISLNYLQLLVSANGNPNLRAKLNFKAIHHNSKDFKCKKCEYTTTLKLNIVQHVIIVHN